MFHAAALAADPELRIPRAEERLCSLREEEALAMTLLRIAGRKAAQAMEADEDPQRGRDYMDAFTRASRALHASLALQPKVEKELASLRAGDPLLETTPRRASSDYSSDPIWDPDEIIDPREILRGNALEIINPDSYDEDERERIYEEIDERLYKSGRYDDFLDLPTEDAVEAICADLGVKPDWERWDGYEWPAWRTDKTRKKPAPPPGAEDWRPLDEAPETGIPPGSPPYGDTG
jgi:hypothetical protein